ncbi:GNAT superfamily N-acetyltransferase/ribosomal protein S17E [Dysgonomonadaceae bacterium PH5-43]|nr:GNAT superfamily N-acetyltransferase/ribosomal protein S17E [Dysgonomonadaceae bacterium PH5-43]
MSIIIKEVTDKATLKKFVVFNIDLYKDCPYHVPALIEDEMATLNKDKNPAFDFCESVYYLAYKNNKIVGRIAGIINHKANEIWEQQYARFSFIDFIDDQEVSAALFNAVEKWALSKGMNGIQGPLGFTDLDHEGLLISGFDKLSTMATSYSFPYYKDHFEKLGYIKDQDWHEFQIHIPKEIPPRMKRISEIVLNKYPNIKIKKFKNTKEIWPYANKIFELWNEAFKPLYGYSPLTERQIEYYVKMYIPMLRLPLISIVINENDDSVIGLGLTLPSLSLALKKAKGSLFPFGWIHLLKAMYGKNNKVVDLYLMGVAPEFQGKGINALLFYDLIPIYNKFGYEIAETNPELEVNTKMQSQWEDIEHEHARTRRAFIKHLQ